MDPITGAIIAAIAAGAAAGVGDIAKQAIIDGYRGLKSLIAERLGAENKVSAAIKELEGNPQSKARKGVLAEEISNSKADQDEKIVVSAQTLLEKVEQGVQVIQTAEAENIRRLIQDATKNPHRGVTQEMKATGDIEDSQQLA